VDVVPVSNIDQWKFDPFSGTIHEGFMYGRGVMDMLYIVACQVVAFCKIQEEKIKPKGDLFLLIVSDEESGGDFGTSHFFKHHSELLALKERKIYAITEGGGSVLYDKLLQLRVGERGSFWKKLIFKGTPGHGAFPYKTDNAVFKAGLAAVRIYKYLHTEMPAVIVEPVKSFLESLSNYEPELKNLLIEQSFNKNLQNLYQNNKKLANSLFSITHLTISPNVLQGGDKVNTVPGFAELELDIRTLPHQTENDVDYHLKKALGDLDPEIKTIFNEDSVQIGSMSPATPEESKFVSAIHKSVQQILPDISIIPSVVGGATDSRYCRVHGIDAYGFSITNPVLKPEEIGPIHGINERLDLKSIDYTLRVYYTLLHTFLIDN
jgi:acetylornithine deacetylase/succinyl-diaminopimelate desuccinylase-like protein